MDEPRHPEASRVDTVSAHLIAVRDMHKSFSTSGTRIEIARGIDFDLDAGEKVAVVGASGIGKSTFLYMLGTLDPPDQGALYFRGENVLCFDAVRLAKFRNDSIGFVFQFHHLLGEFTALENAMMPVLIQGHSKRRAREAAEELLIRVGLADRLHYRVGRLSGGEQQRVALARALICRPMLLLADEPTGNLDRKNSTQVHDLLVELNRELGMTLVVVTHNPELAACMDRRVTFVDGKLVRSGWDKEHDRLRPAVEFP